jgi:hypothetical protein
MKQKIHFLFMLLLMIIGGAGGHAFAATTYKLQKVTSVEAGGLYVFEQAGHVAINTVSSSALQTVAEYKTTGLTGSENYVWELKTGTKGFKISCIKDNYTYEINNASSTAISLVANGSDWVFKFQDDGTALIQNVDNDYRFLGYTSKTSYAYKAYAKSNLSSYPHAIVVYKLVEESSLPSAGLAFAEDSYTATLGEDFTAPTLAYAEGFDGNIEYWSSNESVATVNATTGEVSLVGAGTTTITASFAGNDTYAAGSASYTLTVVDPNAPGTENNPYTVALALENTPESGNSAEVCVKGIVSGFYGTNTNILSDYSHRYYISDDGTETEQLLVYNGKGLNNEAFSSVEDVQVGDVVVIKGQLTTYQGTKEFAKDNYIVSLTRKEKVDAGLAWSAKEASAVRGETFAAPSLTNPNNVVVSYKSSNTKVATIDETGHITLLKAGETTITATFAGDDDYNAAEVSYTLTVTVQSHAATFFVNGQQQGEPVTVAEDEAITFPTVAEELLGKKFVGWTTEAIDGETDEPATLVNAATMGNADVTYYAVYAVRKGEGVSSVTTLTNANIVAAGEGKTGYNFWTITDSNGRKWNAHAVKNQHSNATSEYHYLQIKKSSESEQYYIQVPEMGGTITAMTMTVSGSSQPMTDGNNSSTLFFSNSNLTSATGNGVVSGGGASTVTLDCSSLGLSTGYITSSGAVRIWDVKVTYGTPATYSDYCTTLTLAAPTFSLAAGEVEKGTSVTITAEEDAKVKYTIGETTTTAESNTVTVTINEDVTIKAVAVKDGVESEEVSAAYTVKAEEPAVDPGTPAAITAGFYTIKNLGNNQFVNVAGRKTVTFVDETATAPGTVIKVESNEDGQVQVLRSQGVDLPGYAERAMKYVPKIVQLVAEKLGAEGEGNLLGKDGLGKIMDKFNESFDYHLYTEQGEQGVRIYGKTPSMQPVVDFYKDNKANVDAKLPMLEDFINSAIRKVLDKTNGSGASILTEFSLHEIWEKMGKTLPEPLDADSKLEFLQGVLSNKQYVWDFAYQTAMKYWKPLINHKMVQQKLNELGDLAQYVEKIEYIRPDVKYYIVQKEGKIDFISQDNTLLKETSSEWELTARETFTVNFDKQNVQKEKYYTTLYTDFAYTLPTGVKAMTVTKVAELNGKSIAITETIEGAVPAQTPVLLESATAGDVELTLDVTDGTAIENLLKGNDWLVNLLNITTPQVDKLFGIVHDLLKYENMESLYDRYVKEYEYLKKRNAGTVNNKYFFALSGDDIAEAPGKTNVCQFTKDEQGLAFSYNLEQSPANKAFLPGDKDPVYLSFVGDVNRDGKVSVADVNALVEIVLGKVTEGDTHNYDFEAAHVNADEDITIADVTALVNIILGK